MGRIFVTVVGVKHTFSLRGQWSDDSHPNRGFSRNVDIQADGPGELAGSAARAFHGDTQRWNPEQLVLAALVQCHILSYLHVAQVAGVAVNRIHCSGSVDLTFDKDGGQITSAVLKPQVWLADEMQREFAKELHQKAHQECFIARSVNFPVSFEFPDEHQMPELPKFSSRLGAPIAVLRPRQAKKPSSVTGLENRPRSGGSQKPVQPVNNQPGEQKIFYDQVGGEATFTQLAAKFYEQVSADEEFRAMYPEEDLGPAEERLRLFLMQYWGGPNTYSQQRGHPRLRMRHNPYRIGPAERDTWLKYMRVAVESLGLSELHESTLWDYLERAAHAMQNAAD